MYEPDINEYPPIEEAVVAAPVVEEEVVSPEEAPIVEELPVVEEVATEDAPIVEEPPAPRRTRKKKADDNIETVRVITDTKNGSVGVDFRGFGLRLQTDIKYERGDLVQVKYEGIITTPDFKAELV